MQKLDIKQAVVAVVAEIIRGYKTKRVVIHARTVAKKLRRMGYIKNIRGGEVKRISVILANLFGKSTEKAQGRIIYVLDREEALRKLGYVRAN